LRHQKRKRKRKKERKKARKKGTVTTEVAEGGGKKTPLAVNLS